MNSDINSQFFLSHPNIFPSSLLSFWFLFKKLSLFKNSSLTKSTLAVALSHKELASCLSIEVHSTICDEEWSSKNIGSTLNIGTQNFDLIGFFFMFEFISLSYELMIWWFWMIFYCSSPLSRFRFWVFASFLSVYLSLCSWSFLYFFYLVNLIRVN